jgi:hypothetical protein
MIPLLISDEDIQALEETGGTIQYASKTYKFDFETGEIYAEFVDLEDAIRQGVIKAILTARDRYIIYSSDYGCEISYLMGKAYSLDYLQIEVPRLIQEALIPDERVSEAKDFTISKDGDILVITFTVITDLQSEVDVEVNI